MLLFLLFFFDPFADPFSFWGGFSCCLAPTQGAFRVKENWEERGDDSFFAFPRLFVLAGMDGIVFSFFLGPRRAISSSKWPPPMHGVSRARVWAWDGLLRISWLQWHIVIAANYSRSKFIPNYQRRKRGDCRITGEYRDLILMSSHTFLSSTLNISFPGRSPRLYYHDNARPFSSPPPPPPFFAIVFSPQVRTKTDNQVSEKKEEKWMEEERE